MKLAFIHRGSQTAKMIMRETGIPSWGRGVRAEKIINYGVTGERFEDWKRRNPMGQRLPMFNKPLGLNKFEVVKKVEEEGICVPRSRREIKLRHAPEGWLVKPFWSQGGRGIEIAEGRDAPYGKYFQEFIHDRIYELRIHAFNWIALEEWVVQKKVPGEDCDAITWNHHTGGTFITVNDRGGKVFQDALEMSDKVLEVLELDFGGVDFVVNGNREVYFIEINTAVGCHGLSDPVYVDAFERLKGL